MLFAVALFPYLTLFGPVSILLLLAARRWILVVVAVGLTAATVAIQLPLFFGPNVPENSGAPVRVMTANLREGNADPQYLAESARVQADVVAFQELTPTSVVRLSEAGLDMAFPYRWLDAREASQGVGLWSRYPLEATRRIAGYTFAMVSARIRVADVSKAPTVLVVHMSGPWPNPIDDWRRDWDHLPTTLREAADWAAGGCVIVAGDLNATRDMRPVRGLMRDGYRDAAEQSKVGFKPTFPGDSRLPPLVAIDHILTRSCTATSLQTVKLRGSDHRGITATVTVPLTA